MAYRKFNPEFKRGVREEWRSGQKPIGTGPARDRIASVHDAEQRHGHTSHGKSSTPH